MVDLNLLRGIFPTHEINDLPGVRIVKNARDHHASARVFMLFCSEIPVENVIAGIASVTVDIAPGISELGTGVPGLRSAAFNGKGIEDAQGLTSLVRSYRRRSLRLNGAGIRIDDSDGSGANLGTRMSRRSIGIILFG